MTLTSSEVEKLMKDLADVKVATDNLIKQVAKANIERDLAQLDAMRMRQNIAVGNLIAKQRDALLDKCRRYQALLKQIKGEVSK